MKAAKKTRPAGKKTTVEIFGRTFTKLKGGGIDIDGHLLTPEQLEQFRDDVVSRFHAIKTGSDEERAEQAVRLALGHILWQYRPTSTAKEWLRGIVNDLESVSHALMALEGYPYYQTGPAALRGIEALNGLRGDLNRVVDAMTHLNTAMTAERNGGLKLQEMMDRREAFESLRSGGPRRLEFLILDDVRKAAMTRKVSV